jgi:hypothetical protein
MWSPGICHWFRERALPRVTARLCALVILLNMFAPFVWAVAAPSPDADAAPACHDIAPVDAANHSKPAAGHVPHCPLCVLFGGTAWAPPIVVAVTLAVAPGHAAPVSIAPVRLSIRLPSTLRPSPRAPPALI